MNSFEKNRMEKLKNSCGNSCFAWFLENEGHIIMKILYLYIIGLKQVTVQANKETYLDI